MKNIFIPLFYLLLICTCAFIFSTTIKTEEKFPKKEFPNEAYFLEKHKGHLQEDQLLFQQACAKESLSRNTKSRNYQLPWQIEGPYNTGGRINCITPHPTNPSVFYIGTPDGGVFKTTDAGNTYTSIFDQATSQSISSIVFDPTNINTMYVGTGDNVLGGYSHMGNGIYKSTDGGITWINKGLTNVGCVSKIIVDKNNAQIIFAATTGNSFIQDNNRGVYKSTDGGNTWTNVLFPSNSAGVYDLIMDFSNSQVLYATGRNRTRTNTSSTIFGPETKIYKTIDGGANWATLANGLPNTSTDCKIGLAMMPNNSQILFANYVDSNMNFSGVYKTTNAGASWSLISDSSAVSTINMGGFGWYFGGIYIDPYNTNNMYIDAVDLYKSTDGGISWNALTNYFSVHSDKHSLVFLGNSNTFLLGTDGGVYKTTDGTTFTTLNNYPITQFYRIACSPFDSLNYYGGAQDNGTNVGNISTQNNWIKYYGGDGFKPAFNPIDSNIMYAETQNGNIVSSDNGGQSWMQFTSTIPTTDVFWWDAPYFISNGFPDNLYCGTHKVYKTTSGPYEAWFPISNDLTDGINTPGFHFITALTENMFNTGYIYAGTNDGNLSYTTNDGASWTKATASILPDRYVTGITTSPNNSNNVYVCYSGFRNGSNTPYLFASKDNCSTFTNIAGNLPSFCINDIYVVKGHADSNIVIATDGGVYFTKNAGATWDRVGNNMPIIPVYDIDVNHATRKLVAGTFARSMQTYPMDSLFANPSPNGINNMNELDAQIKLYPVPTNNEIYVQNNAKSNLSLALYNSNGALLFTSNQNIVLQKYNTSNLPNGNYIVKITTNNSTISKKIVVVH